MGPNQGASGKPSSEINITPLVDVVLVLLIIFMVITPVLRVGRNVSVPPRAPTGDRQAVRGQLIVRVEAGGGLFINSEPVAPGAFAARLRQVLTGREVEPTFVAAEAAVPYQNVIGLMDLCREAGAANIAVVVDDLAAP